MYTCGQSAGKKNYGKKDMVSGMIDYGLVKKAGEKMRTEQLLIVSKQIERLKKENPFVSIYAEITKNSEGVTDLELPNSTEFDGINKNEYVLFYKSLISYKKTLIPEDKE